MTPPTTRFPRRTILAGASLLALALTSPVQAGPTGGTVTDGAASIDGDGAGNVTVTQASERAIIDWQSFSIDAGESARFIQPNASSIAVNRVIGVDPSTILGSLSANGQVVLINRNGIAFGKGATVDAGGLVATTADIDRNAFMAAGQLRFSGGDAVSGASVVNEGRITVREAGLAALVAPHVRNSGSITANLGRVALGAGTGFTVDFFGDGLITFAPDGIVGATVGDGATALVDNDGLIEASGGTVTLSAAAAREVVNASVNVGGIVRADSIARQGGEIVLSGPGRITADGVITANSGAHAGGRIAIDGGSVALGGLISASGAHGGAIQVGARGALSLAETVAATGSLGDGGAIHFSAGHIVETSTSRSDASGLIDGGAIRVTSGGSFITSGAYVADGVYGNGGRIDLGGRSLSLLSTSLSARGRLMGGLVRVGGAFQGGKAVDPARPYHDSFVGRWGALPALANADTLFVSSGSVIDVSSSRGAGGASVLWSQDRTTFLGGVEAKGALGGGAVEISSAGDLRQANLIDVEIGGGHLLLDPKNIVIGDAAEVSGWAYQGIMGAGYFGTDSTDVGLDAFDVFGSSVALNAAGDRLAIGAVGDNGARGVSPDSYGAVYLFSFTDGNFSGAALQAVIGSGYAGGKNLSVGLGANDRFGAGLAFNAAGDRLAVGASGDDGYGDPGTTNDAGAVYLFSFTDNDFSGGSLGGILGSGYSGASDVSVGLDAGDEFGAAVSFNATGDRLAVGAPKDDGYNSSGADDFGSVHLFAFADTDFSGGALASSIGFGYETDPALDAADLFGSAVSFNAAGTALAVGAHGDDGASNDTDDSGAVHLFTFSDTSFGGGVLQASIGKDYAGGKNRSAALGTGDWFGYSVSLNAAGNRLAIGAVGNDGMDAPSVAGGSPGAVYLYSFTDGLFLDGVLEATLGAGHTGGKNMAINLGATDQFGASVALNGPGDRLAAGAIGDAGSTDDVSEAGAVHLFTFADTDFSGGRQTGIVGNGFAGTAHDVDLALGAGDQFGAGIALNGAGDRMAVGAPFDDGFGDPGATDDTGAVYLFSFTDDSFNGAALQAIIGSGYTGGKNRSVALDSNDGFGTGLAFNAAGDRLAIGAHRDDGHDNLGPDGEVTDTVSGVVGNTGAVRLFTFDESDGAFSNGVHVGTIGYGYTGPGDLDLGESVADPGSRLDVGSTFGVFLALNADGTRLAVGSHGDKGYDNDLIGVGAAYLFTFDDGDFFNPEHVGTVGSGYVGANDIDVSSLLDARDLFGRSVALNAAGDRLVVTSSTDDGPDEDTTLATHNFGAAYLFTFTDDDGAFSGGDLKTIIGHGYTDTPDYIGIDTSAYIRASDNFGLASALSADGGVMAITAQAHDGWNNDIAPDANSGAVFLFRFDEGDFTNPHLTTIFGKDYGGLDFGVEGLQGNDNFGFTVALDGAGARMAVGASGDDGAGNAATNAGAVHLLALDPDFGSGFAYTDGAGATANVAADQLAWQLSRGTNITLQANNDITVSSAVAVDNADGDGGGLTLQAGRSILINADIATDNGDLTLIANDLLENGVVDAYRDGDEAAVVTMAPGASIDAGVGAVRIDVRSGAGKSNSGMGSVTLRDIVAGSLTVGNVSTAGDILLNGNVTTSGAQDYASARDIRLGAGAVLSISGEAAATLTAARQISLAAGSWIENTNTAATGHFDAIVLNANLANTAASDSIGYNGIDISGATLVTGGMGDIRLTGYGSASSNASLQTRHGIMLNGATVETLAGGGVHLIGHGGDGASNRAMSGVYLSGGGKIATRDGAIDVDAYGSGAGAQWIPALYVWAGEIAASGTGAISLYGEGSSLGSGQGVWIGEHAPSTTSSRVWSNSGAIHIAGVGGGVGNDNNGIQINKAQVDSVSGAITMDGTVAITTGNNHGIYLLGAADVHSETGAISLTGAGSNYGVYLEAATVRSTGTAPGAATITLNGTGGSGGTSTNVGVYLNGGDASIISAYGDIGITGEGGANASGSHGVMLAGGASIESTGIGADAATITLDGVGGGGATSPSNNGVYVAGGNTLISSNDGIISITGKGGQVSGTSNHGVQVSGGARVVSAALAQPVGPDGVLPIIRIQGTGGGIGAATTGHGVYFSGTNTGIFSDVGDILIEGTGGGGTADNHGLVIRPGARIESTGANSDIVIDATGGDGASSKDLNNTGGAGAVSSGGRWIIYLTSPDRSNFGNLASDNLPVWGQSILTLAPEEAPSGNRYVFAHQPTLAVSTSFTDSKSYGTEYTFPSPLQGVNYSISGIVAASDHQSVWTQETLTDLGISGAPVFSSAGAAAAANVAGSPYGISISNGTLANSAGYTFGTPFSTGTLTVTPKTLTLAGVTAADKVYDGDNEADLGGGVLDGVFGEDDVKFVAGSGSFANRDAGTWAVTAADYTLTGDDAGNYTLTQPVVADATITARTLTLSGVSAAGKAYDGNTAAILSGGALHGVVGSEDVGFTAGAGAFASKAVGTWGVTVSGYGLSGDDAGNYTLTQPVVADAAITAKTLTLLGVSAAGKVYDGDATATLSGGALDGVVGGEDVSFTTGAGVFANKNVGTWAVTASGYALGGGDAGNYTLTQPTIAEATIEPKVLTLAGVSAAGKDYDGDATATLSGGALDGVVGSEDVDFSAGAGSFANKNIGTWSITASGYALTGEDVRNYTLAQPVVGDATISAKALALLGVSAAGKVYDGNADAVLSGGALDGVVGGEDVGFTVGAGVFASKNVGTWSVRTSGYGLNGDDAGNYTLTQPTVADAAITAKVLALLGVNAADKIYDGNAAAVLAGGALVGIVGSDDVNFAAGNGAFASKDVGTWSVTASGYGLNGGDAGNYTLIQPTVANATIASKALALSGVSAAEKEYDGNTHAALSGGALVGVVGSEDVSFVSGSGVFASKNAGTHVVTASGYALSGDDAGNYTLAQPLVADAAISARMLTIGAPMIADKVYDGKPAAGALSVGVLGNLAAGETVVVTGSAAALSGSDVGSYTTTVNYGLADGDNGGLASNYVLADSTGVAAAITAKALALTGVSAADKIYDGAIDAGLSGGALIGVVVGDDVDFTAGAGVFASKNVGTWGVIASGYALSGGDSANYTLTQPTVADATITAKTLALSGVTAADKEYDGNAAATLLGGSLDGVVASDDVSFTAGAGTFASKDAGAWAVTVAGYTLDGADAGNYTLTQPAVGDATITAKTLILLGVGAAGKVYDGSADAALSGGSLDGVVDGDHVNFMAGAGVFASKNVGTWSITASGYALTGGDAGNYMLTQPTVADATITAKTLALSGVTAAGKEYDGNAAATLLGGSLNGIVASDDVSFTAGTGVFASKNVGVREVTASGYGLSGDDAGNYTLSQPTVASATITAKALTLLGVVASGKIYDGDTDAGLSGGALDGIVDGDDIDFTAGSGSFGSRNVGTWTVTASGYGLAGEDASNYALAQPAVANATITAKALTLTGVTAASKVYDGDAIANLSGGSLHGIVDGDNVEVSAGTGSFVDSSVGTWAVAADGYSLTGDDAGNYTLTQPTVAGATITAKVLTLLGVTASGKVYDGGTIATLSGGALDSLVGSDDVGFTAGAGAFASKNVGAWAVTASGYGLSGADAGNYTLTQPTVADATITAKALALSGVTAAGKEYDGDTAAILRGGALVGIVGDEDVSFTAGSGNFASKNAGTWEVTASGYGLSGGDAGNYTLSQPLVGLATIGARALVVGVAALDKVYDGARSASLTFSTSDLVGSDEVGYSYAVLFADKAAGTGKAVLVTDEVTLTGADAGNYSLVIHPDDLAALAADISARTLTVGSVAALGKTYDGGDEADLSITTADVLSGDTVIFDYTAAFSDKNAGIGKGVIVGDVALGGADGGNYRLVLDPALLDGLTADIARKTLTLDAAGTLDKIYDGASTVELDLSTGDILAGDDIGFGYRAQTANAAAGTAKTVTVAGEAIALQGADALNYDLQYDTAILSGLTVDVAAKSLVVTGVAALDKIYDGGTAASLSFVTSGIVEDDSVAFDHAAAFADKAAGLDRTVTATGEVALSGTDAANYRLVLDPALLADLVADITARTLTVSDVLALAKTYDGATGARLGFVTDALAGDEIGFDYAALFADANAGEGKAVTVTDGLVTLSGEDAGNYVLALDPVFLDGLVADIARKNLTVTDVTAAGKSYDGTRNVALDFAADDMISGDDIAYAYEALAAAQGAGAQGVTVTDGAVSLVGNSARNYSLALDPALLADLSVDIATRMVTVSAVSAEDKVYDGAASASLSVIADGILGADDVVFDYAASFLDKAVGVEKAVRVAGGAMSLTGADAANYRFAFDPALLQGLTADITARTLTVSDVIALGKVYDGSRRAALDFVTDGLVAGDEIDFGYAAFFGDRNAGVGKPIAVSDGLVTLTGGDSGNYTLSLDAALLLGLVAEVDRRTVTVTGVSTEAKTYDGASAIGLRFTTSGSVAGDDLGFTYDARTADGNAGMGKAVTVEGVALSGGDAGSYDLALDDSLLAGLTTDVALKELIVAVDDQTRPRFMPNPAFTYRLVGLVGGDDLSAISGLMLSSDATPASPLGAYSIHAANGSAANYAISYEFGTLTVIADQVPSFDRDRVVHAPEGFHGRFGLPIDLSGLNVTSQMLGDLAAYVEPFGIMESGGAGDTPFCSNGRRSNPSRRLLPYLQLNMQGRALYCLGDPTGFGR